MQAIKAMSAQPVRQATGDLRWRVETVVGEDVETTGSHFGRWGPPGG